MAELGPVTFNEYDVGGQFAEVRQWEADHRRTPFRPMKPIHRRTVVSGMSGGMGSGLSVTMKSADKF